MPAAQIKDVADVAEHPQLRARDRWRTIATPNASVPALLPPITFDDVETAMGDVPALGSTPGRCSRRPAWTRTSSSPVALRSNHP